MSEVSQASSDSEYSVEDRDYDSVEEVKAIESDEEEGEEEERDEVISEIEKCKDNYLEIKIVAPQDRLTSSMLQMPEISRILSIRATQIRDGSQVYTDITGLNNPEDMAKKELLDILTSRTNEFVHSKKEIVNHPFKVRRQVDTNLYEEWDVSEMSIPPAHLQLFQH